MARLSWASLLFQVPTLVDAARRLYDATRTGAGDAGPPPAPEEVDALRHALDALEEREMHQATALAELGRQLERLTAAIDVLRRRITLALVTGAVAAVLAVAALVLTLR
jgi:hypothetical protein